MALVVERRVAELSRLTAFVAKVTIGFEDHARRTGVRVVIFGSSGRGDFVASGVLDVMIDGPEEQLRAARDLAEKLWQRNALRHNIHLGPEVSEPLMMRVPRDGRGIS